MARKRVPWRALGARLAKQAGRGFEAKTRVDGSRLEGVFSLVLNPNEVPRRGGTSSATGRRLIVALPSRTFGQPPHDFSASWSSTFDSGDIVLPSGYEVVSETFATVELTRCTRGCEQCETHAVFQQGYPGDGEGGFSLPASAFAEDGPPDNPKSLVLYLEQRISVGLSEPFSH